jgi:hypothetical protein
MGDLGADLNRRKTKVVKPVGKSVKSGFMKRLA